MRTAWNWPGPPLRASVRPGESRKNLAEVLGARLLDVLRGDHRDGAAGALDRLRRAGRRHHDVGGLRLRRSCGRDEGGCRKGAAHNDRHETSSAPPADMSVYA
jgi:hypothetical protein